LKKVHGAISEPKMEPQPGIIRCSFTLKKNESL
jgi:hypothetical protein